MRRVTSLGALYYYVWALPHLVSDDPLAAYRFAAVLGVLALAGTWAFARRAWGARAALVSLAVLATARIAVIDGRVAWAPAALPGDGRAPALAARRSRDRRTDGGARSGARHRGAASPRHGRLGARRRRPRAPAAPRSAGARGRARSVRSSPARPRSTPPSPTPAATPALRRCRVVGRSRTCSRAPPRSRVSSGTCRARSGNGRTRPSPRCS